MNIKDRLLELASRAEQNADRMILLAIDREKAGIEVPTIWRAAESAENRAKAFRAEAEAIR